MNKRNKYRNLLIISIVFLIIFFILTFIGNAYTTNDSSEKKSRVYSHRGACGEEIEHTFPAYDLAILYGSQYIEQDLVTSKDLTLYVSHDLSAKRITGVDKLYSEMTNSEINNLRTKNNDQILSLQQVFNKYKNTINYVIELKENDNQTILFRDIVIKNKLEKNIIVQAEDIDALNNINNYFPRMKKMLIVNNQDELELAVYFDSIDIISANKSLMNKENLDLVHEYGKELNVWTINTTEEIEKAIQLNIDSYFTDFTAKALTLEKKYENKKDE